MATRKYFTKEFKLEAVRLSSNPASPALNSTGNWACVATN